jgi:hypothetical protein
MISPSVGWFLLHFCDYPPQRILMHYCPDLVETIVSLQHVCLPTHPLSTDGLSLLARHSKHSYNFIFVTRLTPSLLPCSLIMSYTFSLLHPTFVHLLPFDLSYPPNCGINVLAILVLLNAIAKHGTGVPSQLVSSAHPFRHCQICSDANPKRSPMGPTLSTCKLLSATRVHIGFGFMCASSEKYRPQKGAPCVVTSVDGFNTYLLIADAKTCYTFVFLTVSKAPPLQILDQFLAKHGLNTGSRFLRMDQGGEFWCAALICGVAAQHGYDIEPTGSDSANHNGKVEQLNGTFGDMVRALLYSAGL